MVNDDKIQSFLDFHFVPFNKKQCIKRVICIWIFSTILCFIGKRSLTWILFFGFINVTENILFIILAVRFPSDRISRYLCDGFFFLYMSIILNVASYRVITLVTTPHWVLLFVFLSLLVIFISLLLLVTRSNVKNNRFLDIGKDKAILWLPLVCGSCGILTARLFLREQPVQVALATVAFIFLILSFIISIPSVNIFKGILYWSRQKNDNNNQRTVSD